MPLPENLNPAQLHPATRLVVWLLLAVSMPWQQPLSLLVVNLLLLELLLASRPAGFVNLLRRTRWLLLSLLVIYAFATPGDPLFPDVSFSPTREGLHAGAIQVWRLGTLLAALAWTLSSLSRSDLLSGMILLLRPFKRVGLNAEQVAIRIWLTLHYAEQIKVRPGSWRESFRDAQLSPITSEERIVLEVRTLTWRDLLAVLVALLAFAGLLVL